MLLSSIKSIWLYPMIVDFRKQLDGLIVLIVDALDKDPSMGDLFTFRNRSGNKLKCVYFLWEVFLGKEEKENTCVFPMSTLSRMARQE